MWAKAQALETHVNGTRTQAQVGQRTLCLWIVISAGAARVAGVAHHVPRHGIVGSGEKGAMPPPPVRRMNVTSRRDVHQVVMRGVPRVRRSDGDTSPFMSMPAGMPREEGSAQCVRLPRGRRVMLVPCCRLIVCLCPPSTVLPSRKRGSAAYQQLLLPQHTPATAVKVCRRRGLRSRLPARKAHTQEGWGARRLEMPRVVSAKPLLCHCRALFFSIPAHCLR